MGCVLPGPWGSWNFGTINDGTLQRGWAFPPKPICAAQSGYIDWRAIQLYPDNNGPHLEKILANAIYAQFAARAYDDGNLKGASPWPRSFQPFQSLLDRLFNRWEIEYDNWSLGLNDADGVRALVLKRSNERVVAFRGSTGHKIGMPIGNIYRQSRDWITDNNLRNGVNIESLPELQEALRFAEPFRNVSDMTFTGHSLGGSIAQYVAVAFGGKRAVSFDAVPIRASLAKSAIKNPNVAQITDFYGRNDPAHQLGRGIDCEEIEVGVPDSISILQHIAIQNFPKVSVTGGQADVLADLYLGIKRLWPLLVGAGLIDVSSGTGLKAIGGNHSIEFLAGAMLFTKTLKAVGSFTDPMTT